MIYLQLHQARSEEIERGASREISLHERKSRYCSEISLLRRNFATTVKFSYNSEIFATPKNSLPVGNFAT